MIKGIIIILLLIVIFKQVSIETDSIGAARCITLSPNDKKDVYIKIIKEQQSVISDQEMKLNKMLEEHSYEEL